MMTRFSSGFRLSARTVVLSAMLAGTSGLSLSACSLGSPSRVNISPIGVVHDVQDHQVAAAALDDRAAEVLAEHYRRYGAGPVDVTVTYEPSTGEARAQNESRRIAALLARNGVGDVRAGALPVAAGAGTLQALVHYEQILAQTPAGCEGHFSEDRSRIIGNEDGTIPDYRFGCGVDTYIARQVARPRDLLGSDRIDPSEGSRPGTQVKDYRDGKDYKDLKGQNASETSL